MNRRAALEDFARRVWTTDGATSRLLLPISAVWAAVAGARMRRAPDGRAERAVIAVGNFTAGGAGKTPTVAALVRAAQASGLTASVVTRGHGGRLFGPVVVDPAQHRCIDVGDEALLHASLAPTVVARDRLAGARLAVARGAELVLLDDGLQNPRLAKDLRIVVVDAAAGVGNGRVMPAGPLRAPLALQLAQTDALVIIRGAEASHPSTAALIAEAGRRGIAVHEARLVARASADLVGRRVVAFAGIGRPEKFAATLRACGAEVMDFVAFADHHPYDDADAAAILTRAADLGALPATTAKDMARFAGVGGRALGRLAAAARVVDVDLVFDAPSTAATLLDLAIARKGGERGAA